jgi:hypothetical protein
VSLSLATRFSLGGSAQESDKVSDWRGFERFAVLSTAKPDAFVGTLQRIRRCSPTPSPPHWWGRAILLKQTPQATPGTACKTQNSHPLPRRLGDSDRAGGLPRSRSESRHHRYHPVLAEHHADPQATQLVRPHSSLRAGYRCAITRRVAKLIVRSANLLATSGSYAC